MFHLVTSGQTSRREFPGFSYGKNYIILHISNMKTYTSIKKTNESAS